MTIRDRRTHRQLFVPDSDETVLAVAATDCSIL